MREVVIFVAFVIGCGGAPVRPASVFARRTVAAQGFSAELPTRWAIRDVGAAVLIAPAEPPADGTFVIVGAAQSTVAPKAYIERTSLRDVALTPGTKASLSGRTSEEWRGTAKAGSLAVDVRVVRITSADNRATFIVGAWPRGTSDGAEVYDRVLRTIRLDAATGAPAGSSAPWLAPPKEKPPMEDDDARAPAPRGKAVAS